MESIMFRIINLKELYRLEEEIDHMEDSKERDARTLLIKQIMEKITDYDVHVREYAYRQSIQALIDRGITFTRVDRASIVANWDDLFDRPVSRESRQAVPHYSDQFRWHLFSFDLLAATKGNDARTHFDEMKKQELFLFF